MRTFAIALLCASTLQGFAADPLIIHEWGTFTSLQDEQGRTIGGLNVDEESLPHFVHDLRPLRMHQNREIPTTKIFKGMSACHPSVTMRLETPVVYVHLAPGQASATLDLSVTFHGGILSQFFPLAEPSVDGRLLRWRDVTYTQSTEPKSYTMRELHVHGSDANGVSQWRPWEAPELSAKTTSALTWRDIRAGGPAALWETKSPVWLAPRAVDAADLTVGNESERYLFYRGLAHLDAPLVAKRSEDGQSLRVSPRAGDLDPSMVPQVWLADLRGDGTAAFSTVAATDHKARSRSGPAFSDIPATFAADEYSAERLATLRQELHAALVVDGLFPDEAHALLNTWEASYFKAPGQRLFFLVPRVWTDRVLPLTSSTPAIFTRSMMGRIEVVSPAQRQALNTIAAGPVSTPAWYDQFLKEHIGSMSEKSHLTIERPDGSEIHRRLQSGEHGVFTSLKIALPADYQAYLSLGRFRDALVWDFQRHTPDAEMARFLRTYVVDPPYAQEWQKIALGIKPPQTSTAP